MFYNDEDENRIEVIRAHDQIIHFYYVCGRKMWRAFGRLQALYDAPPEKFRKYHTRQEFEQWASNYSLWDQSWVGCNIPAKVAYELDKFPDLDKEERFVVDAVKAANLPEDSYITSSSGCNWALRHEICHALWYCFPAYREKCMAVMNDPIHQKARDKEFKYLTSIGYKDTSLYDECNAYLGSGGSNFLGSSLSELLNACLEESGIDFDYLDSLGEIRTFRLNENDEPELI